MVKIFSAVWSKFGRPVFYLFGPLDSAVCTSPPYTRGLRENSNLTCTRPFYNGRGHTAAKSIWEYLYFKLNKMTW